MAEQYKKLLNLDPVPVNRPQQAAAAAVSHRPSPVVYSVDSDSDDEIVPLPLSRPSTSSKPVSTRVPTSSSSSAGSSSTSHFAYNPSAVTRGLYSTSAFNTFARSGHSSSSAGAPLPRPTVNQPWGYVPNSKPAFISSNLFAPSSRSGGDSNSSTSKPRSGSAAATRSHSPDEGEDFDVEAVPMTSEDREIAGDADKHMRELLEGALGQDTAFDENDATVVGFRENIVLMPHQVQGVAWMKTRETGRKSCGILADDMGLGKTVQTLATILQGRPTAAHRKAGYKGGTLVVCPLAVMEQWKDEVKKKTVKGLLKVTTHHGPSRLEDARALEKFDVVITTYQVVASEHATYLASKAKEVDSGDSDSEENSFGSSLGKPNKKGTKKPAPTKKKAAGKSFCALFGVKWHRIVLDEAQNIKNRTTKAAKACIDLPGKFRWCLTGTPIQNNVDELFSLFAFLRCRPLDDWDTFREQISKPVKAGRTKYAMKKLQVILKAIMLRRLKTAELNGKRILNLPERTVTVVNCTFDHDERTFYRALAERTALTMSKFMKAGTVMENYTSILTMLLRLRQACDHPTLVSKSFTSDPDALSAPPPPSAAKEDKDIADELADLFGDLGVAKAVPKCTICSAALPSSTSDDGEVKSYSGDFCSTECEKVSRRARRMSAEVEEGGSAPSSAKIRKILKILSKIQTKGKGVEKTIIFSQFTSMLDVIEPFLRKDGHKFVRYDGSMVDAKRQVSLDAIKNDPETRVILISFKAGSTGLNLTCANHVILVDLWWNPALEDQAFDRAHRLGQTRNVEIYKLAIPETVEDRILQLQEKKRELAAAALSGDKFKTGNKLGLEDIMALFKPYSGYGRNNDSDED